MFRPHLFRNIPASVVALSLVSLVVMMGSSMVTPSITLYADELGASEFLIGAVVAGFAIGRLAFDIPSGFLTGNTGITRAMIIGLMVLASSSFVAGYAPNYLVLLLARFFEGVGSSIYVSAAITFVLISSDQVRRRTDMGAYQSILMMGPIVGPVIGAPIAMSGGYGAPYFAFSAMMIAALVATIALSRKLTLSKYLSSDREPGQTQISTYLNSASIASFGFTFLRSGIYVTAMPLFAYQGLSISVFDVGLILTIASLANLLTSFFSGRLTTKYGIQKSLIAIILSSGVLVATIPFTASVLHLLAIMTLIGATSGFFGQSVAWAADQIEEKARTAKSKVQTKSTKALSGIHSHVAKGMGFNRTVGDAGLVVGPLFVGYLISMFSSSQFVWIISFGISGMIIVAVALVLPVLNNNAGKKK